MAFKVQIQAYDASANTADSAIVTTNYPPTPGSGIVCKVREGGAWVNAVVKVREGGAWVEATPKVRTGGAWQG